MHPRYSQTLHTKFAGLLPLSQCCISQESHLSSGSQGYCLAGNTPLKVAKAVDDGRDVTNQIACHVIGICYDPDMMQDALFEMWPADLDDDVTNEFKWLKENYSPPEDLSIMLNRKEIVIGFKAAVHKMTRCEILTHVGPNEFRGGALWMPLCTRCNVSMRVR